MLMLDGNLLCQWVNFETECGGRQNVLPHNTNEIALNLKKSICELSNMMFRWQSCQLFIQVRRVPCEMNESNVQSSDMYNSIFEICKAMVFKCIKLDNVTAHVTTGRVNN